MLGKQENIVLNSVGCDCCQGDDAIFWKNDQNNAFVDSTGEMLVTTHGKTIRFKVSYCPKCGKRFGQPQKMGNEN